MPPSVPKPDRRIRLADRLDAIRRGRFVGRQDELAAFRSTLLEEEPSFAVMYIYGPGGVGKSALLREFARAAAECGRTVIQLDARNVEPTRAGFLAALKQALGQAEDDCEPASDWPPHSVLVIDTYEVLAPLDPWLRESLLPQLPATSIVVLAGRTPPTPEWRVDMAWGGLTRIMALRNLRPEESQTYLATRGIPEEHHAEALSFTRGHPLALALVADVLSRGEKLAIFDPRSEPDVVRVLLERFVHEVPGPLYRLALETCVLMWATTETVLADVVDSAGAHNLFEWLRQQSFIEQGPHGLFPHDLARDVLDADLRWRDPAGSQKLIARLLAQVYARFQEARGVEQQRVWFDLLYFNRQNPYFRPYFEWAALGATYAEPATPQDHAAIVEMTRQHQGDAGARIAQHWLGRQPHAFLVYRDIAGALSGFMAQLTLHDTTPEDAAVDPAVPAALTFAQRRGPVRSGEEIVYLRFWMDRDAYQGVSSAINLTAINSSIYWISHPKLAWNFIAIAEPESLEPHFTSIHMWRSPEADFEVDGRRYGVFAHDWRVEPVAAWIIVKYGLAAVTDFAAERPTVPPPSPLLVLSEVEFGDAVRQALRDFTRLDRLATNPLVRTRLVVGGREQDAPPAILRALLREAVASLAANPKGAKLHRALWHTYFEPAPTQEQAAELLGLPFNTYRYQLAKGIEHVTATLWRREVEEAALSPLQPLVGP